MDPFLKLLKGVKRSHIPICLFAIIKIFKNWLIHKMQFFTLQIVSNENKYMLKIVLIILFTQKIKYLAKYAFASKKVKFN